MLFLPELLYRFSFPGEFGIAPGKLGTTPRKPNEGRAKWGAGSGTVWGLKHESNPIKGFLRRNTPTKLFNRLEPCSGASQQPDLVSPNQLNSSQIICSISQQSASKPFSNESVLHCPAFRKGISALIYKDGSRLLRHLSMRAFVTSDQQLYRLKDGRTQTYGPELFGHGNMQPNATPSCLMPT